MGGVCCLAEHRGVQCRTGHDVAGGDDVGEDVGGDDVVVVGEDVGGVDDDGVGGAGDEHDVDAG